MWLSPCQADLPLPRCYEAASCLQKQEDIPQPNLVQPDLKLQPASA